MGTGEGAIQQMNVTKPIVYELTEYAATILPSDAIPIELGTLLWQTYGENGTLRKSVVRIDFPSPITSGQWRLTSQGWVGYIPLSDVLGFRLQPKVGLANIFGMLEYAYNLKSFHFLDGLSHFDTLEELYSFLADILSRRILDRARKGLYRTYVPRSDQMTVVRGRMDTRHLVQKPWEVTIKCHYKDHTSDIEDNQILLWTLHQMIACGACNPQALTNVRRAYRALQGTVSLGHVAPQAWMKRIYNRLNDDYQALHALCRFFLEQSGPNQTEGNHKMLPFLVNMARLYELFVAEWLKAHRVSHLWTHNLDVKSQHQVEINQEGSLSFNIDLVLFDRTTGQTRYVLDTKYKIPTAPSTEDVAQIIAYATATGCSEAVLIYPEILQMPLDARVQNIHICTLAFAVDGDLSRAGEQFLESLLARQPIARTA
ncbi:McrC family protein [Leptolyngbya sp. GGD]|uniref:McrC family protein n=1 Tax=Leptolyngbya sp. GGD TaxID=2997907 RepID=UPI00227C6542|nr:restriction endonuclease [Leptolyngbya sp. GGD]MCY6493913.1 restriction endonuclease [Leptolyngbya sp. GGD]